MTIDIITGSMLLQDSRGLSCGLRRALALLALRAQLFAEKLTWLTGRLTDLREVQRRARLRRFNARFIRSVAKRHHESQALQTSLESDLCKPCGGGLLNIKHHHVWLCLVDLR